MLLMLLSNTRTAPISGGQRGSEGWTNSGQITVYYGHCHALAAGADNAPRLNWHQHRNIIIWSANSSIPFYKALISRSVVKRVLIANHQVMEQIRVLLSLQLIRIEFQSFCTIYILQLISLESNVVTFDKTN